MMIGHGIASGGWEKANPNVVVSQWYYTMVPTLGLILVVWLLYASGTRHRDILEIIIPLSAADMAMTFTCMVQFLAIFGKFSGATVYVFGSCVGILTSFSMMLTSQRRRRDIKIDRDRLTQPQTDQAILRHNPYAELGGGYQSSPSQPGYAALGTEGDASVGTPTVGEIIPPTSAVAAESPNGNPF
eukprot:TRINITY_DN2080_c0_g1_i2.p1 TRINITY_DN2080_c0_g1~~TRINITY_DN2080_c0_g1_i2.p1  ORF type:complete len:186 (+),score=7.45 TRINITY_DN2080_c0_g1_i2:599-1156(+)